jgi:hypothetical protein
MARIEQEPLLKNVIHPTTAQAREVITETLHAQKRYKN